MAKVFKTLKKKAQATPLVGVILDSLKSENPRQNAPSIQAVIDNMTPPMNKLVNGDFQINQRGQSSYTSAGYGLDVWNFVATSINPISPINGGGILINKSSTNQNVVRQFVDTISVEDVGKEYTLVINIESDKEFIGVIGFGKQRENINIEVGNKIYFHIFTLMESDFEDRDNLDVLVLNVDDKVTNSPQIKIYYADLFEGNIVYQHQKEDYAIALMRCFYYIQKLKGRKAGTYHTSTYTETDVEFYTQMKNNPTVNIIDLYAYGCNIAKGLGTSETVSTNYYKDRVVIGAYHEQTSIEERYIDYDILVTCEQL